MLKKLAFITLLVFFLSNIDQTYAAYITKKSDTSKAVERIEKEFANGNITKAECVKQKSKELKLKKVSETVCDNVEVKTVKAESKEKKKVEYIKKKEKKKKKAKKEFIKKAKKISKDAKSWITKKLKKEKHYKTIAELPKSDFYFTAADGEGNIFIGYIKGDPNSKDMKVGNRKFKKISNGQAFQNDKKTQCRVRSEVDKSKNKDVYTGQVLIKCPKNIFIGIWHQTGNEGFGIAQSEAGIKLDFTFSMNRNDAVASLNNKKKESKTTKKIVKLEKKNYEIKDKTKPLITVVYNNKTFNSLKDKKVDIQCSSKIIINGVVSDKVGASEDINLLVDGKPLKIKQDGSFSINQNCNQSKEVWLTAVDGSGNLSNLEIDLDKLSIASAFKNTKKYHALIIGNNDYDDKEWHDLESPINDIMAIAEILKKKYKFSIPDKFILKNATKNQIEDALYSLNEILTEEDYLLIYYAGHGDRGTNVKRAYWIPTDGKAECCRNWINTSAVTDMISEFKAKHVLLMVDSCFSGLLKGSDENLTDNGEEKNTLNLIKWINRKGRLYISSGSDEPVLDKGEGKHSYFAKKFIELLETNEDHMTDWEMFGKIDAYVQNNSSQRPNHKVIKEAGDNFARFIFSVRN